MNSAAAAQAAGVTVATIRTWCCIGAVAAEKVGGRWIIDAASLARRIQIGADRVHVTVWGLCGHITTSPAYTAAEHIHHRQGTCHRCASANAKATAMERQAARNAEHAERRQRAAARRRTRCECASGRYGGVCTCC